MTEKEMIDWIDNATYEQLLSKWRGAVSGDLFFQGEIGQYYSKKISEKKSEIGNAAHVAASKSIGWGDR